MLNGEAVRKASRPVCDGDLVEIRVPVVTSGGPVPDSAVSFNVVYEDSQVAVVDKPAGLIVHPGAGNEQGTLVHGLLARYGESFSGVGNSKRPGIVHRLDKDTSGLMVVARTGRAYRSLIAQFQPPRSVHRSYFALVSNLPKGRSEEGRGVIDAPIGRDPFTRTKMAVDAPGAREALTRWEVVEGLAFGFLLKLSLETGRTHQIRVHLSARGAPIVGDPVYGARLQDFPGELRPWVREFGRQALHAAELSFAHPESGAMMTFGSELPADFARLLGAFRGWRK